MQIDDAQRDNRRAYVGGGPGALVSALVWLAAAVAARSHPASTAFAVLFVGGLFIFPLGTAIARHGFGRAPATSGNPLGGLALESTIAMIGGLFAAWLFLPLAPARTIPLAAVAVGLHYAAFRSVYGDRRFWLLAALIAGVGVVATVRPWPAGATALTVAVIEGIAGLVLTRRALAA